jgi:hypothetical protein
MKVRSLVPEILGSDRKRRASLVGKVMQCIFPTSALCQHEISKPQLTSPQLYVSGHEPLFSSWSSQMVPVLVPCEVVSLSDEIAKLRTSVLDSDIHVCGQAKSEGAGSSKQVRLSHVMPSQPQLLFT